jgi:predicted hydrocarbon binding protein
MEIKNKPEHDPVADIHMVDAYMRWALLAAEEVVGKQGLAIVLRQAGLERLIDNYPPNNLKVSDTLTYGDYANLSAGLLTFYGRAGKSMTLRIGKISAKHGIEKQSEQFGLATLAAASRLLPIPMQLKMGLETMQNGFRKLAAAVGEEIHLRLEDRGNKIAFVVEDCSMCAGKQASERICWIYNGVLQESIRWQTGKDFEIEEVTCRAMGAPACVWEISKTPKG